MTWQPRKIQVLCPSCNRMYDTWVKPPDSVNEEGSGDDCRSDHCTVKCPACRYEMTCSITFVKDGLFQVQCDKRRN